MTNAFGRPALDSGFGLVLGWILFAAAASALVGFGNLSRLRDEFEAESRTVHRVISQRADQHDAHLTGLSAIVSNSSDFAPTLRPVAESVLRFYPRITAIDVVAVQPNARIVFTTRESGPGTADPVLVAKAVDRLQPGQTVILPDPSKNEYALVKRVPNGAIVMTIDGLRLSESDSVRESGTALLLSTSAGQIVMRRQPEEGIEGHLPVFSFDKGLGSQSQPLGLSIQRQPRLNEILPVPALLLAIAGAGAVALLGWILLRERRAARDARGRAAFHAQDARFAHAARVNTVGEMASGIVHELTQPLTAILSQSQAGLRLARDLNTPGEIVGVLEANARSAKRAGDILSRIREYIANRTPQVRPIALNDLVRHVAEMVSAEIDQGRISLTLDLDPGEPSALVDRLSLEQVVHNLLLNAVDAVQGLPQANRAVGVKTGVGVDTVLILVSDRGPGIPPESLPRLFEPFFTTKSGGMGLGLPICERLVESFGGEIGATNDPAGGAVFTVRLPRSTP